MFYIPTLILDNQCIYFSERYFISELSSIRVRIPVLLLKIHFSHEKLSRNRKQTAPPCSPCSIGPVILFLYRSSKIFIFIILASMVIPTFRVIPRTT